MKIGIIGSGMIGGTLAKLISKAGHEVVISYSRSPEKLSALAKQLGKKVKVGTVEEAMKESNIAILSIKLALLDEVKNQMKHFSEKIIIDTNNPYDVKLAAGQSAATYLQNQLPGIRLVKAFNSLYYELLLSKSFSTPLTTMPVSSNDDEAKEVVKMLIMDIGFEPFDLGGLDNVLLQEPDGSFYNKVLNLKEAETIWNSLRK